jgi:hypothetical protein
MVANGGRAAHEKALLLLHEHAPAKLLRQAPLRAVAVARVSGRRDTESHPVSPAAALAALAPSTLVQLVGSDRWAFGRLARAVRAVPCHRLDVGTDPTQVPDVLRSLLAT